MSEEHQAVENLNWFTIECLHMAQRMIICMRVLAPLLSEDSIMAEERFTAEESRKLAVLFARIWANQQLAQDYDRDPLAVLRGAGIDIGARSAPQLPARPAELEAQNMAAAASGSSASSISCASCPCTGCTASCACCLADQAMRAQFESIQKLAEDPAGREQARALMSSWDVKITVNS